MIYLPMTPGPAKGSSSAPRFAASRRSWSKPKQLRRRRRCKSPSWGTGDAVPFSSVFIFGLTTRNGKVIYVPNFWYVLWFHGARCSVLYLNGSLTGGFTQRRENCMVDLWCVMWFLPVIWCGCHWVFMECDGMLKGRMEESFVCLRISLECF